MAVSASKNRAVSPLLQGLATVTLMVFVLHAAKPVLLPVMLAVLIGFILTPVVRWFEAKKFGRMPSVLITLTITFAVMGGFGWLIGQQIISLAKELPQNRSVIQQKVDALRGSGGPFAELFNMMNEIAVEKPTVQKEMNHPPLESYQPVVIAKLEPQNGLTSLAESAVPVVEPLATAGLVVILFTFLLVNREDMRNRLISLFGRGRLTGTTRVLGDAADRVSRFLLFQFIINASFGIILAIGLEIIGVKYALLWGFLSAMLRFVPYVGTWISAVFPFALSFATSEGWAQPLIVLGFFAVLDIFTGNVVEPLLLGHHTGVSPVALLVAAAFWAWLWGPIGLLLSTPITACLAVIGQHVPRLRPLALLLGDRPPLPKHVAFYQRLMAKDVPEAKKLALQDATDGHMLTAYDQTVLPALHLARRDRDAGGLTAEEETEIFAGAFSIVREIAEEREATNSAPEESETGPMPVVIGTPSHHQVEELPLEMLARVLPAEHLQMQVLGSRILPVEVEQQIAESGATAVVISVLPPGGVPQVIYLCRRLRKRFPEVRIIVAYFGKPQRFDHLLVKLRTAGATYVTTSLIQTRDTLKSIVPAPANNRLVMVNGHSHE
ncbi:AI-2E family transporter [Zavarzinella formosa]|uniref:AI-2E family transporter n=1 Tax=Zavarzinella formosa TaxID=360055 RepID=UPI000309D237|nr:AI-2E family transporter [Zavarzinella formosa]